ncbi:hypothetical protein niasHT_017143 [Heterodera trifolii]|uniref:Domain of unknown function DB domain-containing protein n=1 Tax=Heterodera trifolii TaxID=157864 RepID=A0ABD2L6V1_9BILA
MFSPVSSCAFLALFSAFLCFCSVQVESRVPADFIRNKKFTKCCKDLEVFTPKAVRTMCHYPPSAGQIPPVDVREEVAANLDAYIGCYAAHKNNTQCCYDNGVKGEYFDACRDFCCGGPKPCPRHKQPQRVYYACVSKVKEIVECNKAAWDDLAELVPIAAVGSNRTENGTEH